ncbi:GNAT family N-acetyltransferase [Actinoplanes sp. M2I2]|uniref:GNAT family N-acetyltransferase n=1 Tax=Actinoplanes sp. M2I2 TaxID=1734444 RepID=UPI0020204293|nr:GNAT family N-acetyltransferase [Actinoplanes sp. M2I2]
MIDRALLDHARRLWAELSGATVAFPSTGFEVTVSQRSLLCPPGWVGLVALRGGAVVTAPDEDSAEAVRQALAGVSVKALTDPAFLRHRLPVADVLGPATLAYGDASCLRLVESRTERPATDQIEPGAADHLRQVTAAPIEQRAAARTEQTAPAWNEQAAAARIEQASAAELTSLVGKVSEAEAGEAGLDEVTSPVFVLRSGGEMVAAAGYAIWPAGTAHLSVLTAAEYRGRGLARAVASAAVADASAAGLVSQWRARPEASRRVARALGFVELGAQLSIRLQPAA